MHPNESNMSNDLNHKKVFQDKITPLYFLQLNSNIASELFNY